MDYVVFIMLLKMYVNINASECIRQHELLDFISLDMK